MSTQDRSNRISILMPVFNAEKYLDECIASILKQSHSDFELICVDDHSTDNSRTILDKCSELDTRVKVYSNSAKGIIAALRLAFSQSSGSWITRMDADDIMHVKKLELLLQKLSSAGSSYIATGLVEYFSETGLGEGYKKYEDWLNGLSLEQRNFDEIYKECVIPSPCWMIHRDDLIRAKAFEPDIYPEDYELCFRFREQGFKVITVAERIHYWRDHSTRSSRTREEYSDNRFLELKISKFFDHDHDPQKLLALWGAGSKGKYLAKYLSSSGIEFIWLCDTVNKIGQSIYGVELQSFSDYQFKTTTQLISSVAQRDTDKVLEMKLAKYPKSLIELYSFC